MKVMILNTLAVFYIFVAFVTICFLDEHPEIGLLTIVSLGAAGAYSNLARDAKKEIRDKASIDRPE